MTASLPFRSGPRPRTSDDIPHRQLDQQPPDAGHLDALLDEASTWPGIVEGPSGISVEGARALSIDAATVAGPDEAFLVGREFGHGHAQGDFSLHVTLPVELATRAEAAGWAEPHLWVHTGALPPNVVMLYAPRDAEERDVTLSLLRAAYEFARGSTSLHTPATAPPTGSSRPHDPQESP